MIGFPLTSECLKFRLNLQWSTLPLSLGARMREFQEKSLAHVRLLRGRRCACAAPALSHRLRVSQKPPSYRREPSKEALLSSTGCSVQSLKCYLSEKELDKGIVLVESDYVLRIFRTEVKENV